MIPVVLLIAIVAFSGPIEDMPVRTWYEVPNSNLRDVAPDGWRANVIRPWSGGAYDTKRDRLVVWGGGHGDYAGNELYAFDVNQLKWIRLTDPSDNTTNCSDPYGDGMPNSRHTYDGSVYIPPPIDRFWSAGGSIYQCGNCSGKAWMYDFGANPPESGWDLQVQVGGSCGDVAACDPVTKHVWFLTNINYGSPELFEFDPENLSQPWRLRSNNAIVHNYTTGAIDPTRRLFLTIAGTSYGGYAKTVSYDISLSGSIPYQVLNTSGATEIEGRNGAGFKYDPVSDKMVAWHGGSSVYTLDLDSKVWTKISPSSSNSVSAPPVTASGGVFGRFQYVPSKNVFIAVNAVDENVFFYRLTEGTAAAEFGGEAGREISLTARPNPFNAGTTFRLKSTQNTENRTQKVKIEIFNISGKLVDILCSEFCVLHSGLVWNATGLPPGIYIAKYQAGRKQATLPIIFSR